MRHSDGFGSGVPQYIPRAPFVCMEARLDDLMEIDLNRTIVCVQKTSCTSFHMRGRSLKFLLDRGSYTSLRGSPFCSDYALIAPVNVKVCPTIRFPNSVSALRTIPRLQEYYLHTDSGRPCSVRRTSNQLCTQRADPGKAWSIPVSSST